MDDGFNTEVLEEVGVSDREHQKLILEEVESLRRSLAKETNTGGATFGSAGANSSSSIRLSGL